MSESRQVLQFAELVRRAVASPNGELMVWLGSLEQVQRGGMPDALVDEVCPACHGVRPHAMAFIGNWDQFTCLVCGIKHSKQLVRQQKEKKS